jgi:DNA modification methylase
VAGFLTQQVTDRWAIYNGDSMDMLAGIPDESIHGVIYSPPFGGLYHYSSDDRDLSNAPDYATFWEQYRFFIDELYRVTMPGRTNAVHASLVPSGNTGADAYTDFPGDVIRAHQAVGWQFIARHVIWKEPLAVRNRTLAKNLAHKTIVDNAALGGMAAPDELLIFRKPGADTPVNHPTGLTGTYAGGEQHPAELARYRGWDGDQKANRWSHWIWRRYASSVWDDIRLGRTLPFQPDATGGDEDDAEKHVHPLQLDVIERYVDLRTLPGERVLTPFMGVGSEVYGAVRLGRLGIGCELKPSYYDQAVANLATVDDEDHLDDAEGMFAELEDPVDA